MATDPETGLPEVLGQMIYEQGKVIIDGAIAEAVAAERERILTLLTAEIQHRRTLHGSSVYQLGRLADDLDGLIGGQS